MDDVWDRNWTGSTKTLDVHVAALRRRLAGAAERRDPPARLPTITTLRTPRLPPRGGDRSAGCVTSGGWQGGGVNRLRDATSPYLLQHADNPVDWWEWGDEAFAEARRRGVPVCLSVGYAACHWCHVMAHESFEDEATAAHLNEHFVCVKVDREERPDVDAVYMEATTR